MLSKHVILALIVSLAFCGAMYKCERDGRLKAEQEASISAGVNAANAKATAELQAYQQKLDVAVEQLAADRKEIEGLRQELRSGIQQVLKSNADARKWAATPVPTDFIRMYNKTERIDAVSSTGKEAKP